MVGSGEVGWCGGRGRLGGVGWVWDGVGMGLVGVGWVGRVGVGSKFRAGVGSGEVGWCRIGLG